MSRKFRSVLALRKRRQLLQAAGTKCPDVLHLDSPCDIVAAEPETDDEGNPIEGECGKKKLASFSMKANTGVPMRVRGYYDPIIMDMKGVKLASKSLPVVADHDITASARVGHTTSVKIKRDGIDVEGVISATGQTAQEVQADAANGFPFQASLGAKVDKATYVPEKQAVKVNGRRYKGPVVVAERTTIYEFTVTSWGQTKTLLSKLPHQAAREVERWVSNNGCKPTAGTQVP